MVNTKTMIDRRFEAVAWGLLFIWWGLRWSLLIFLPNGSGLLGSGLILLGLLGIRVLMGLVTNGFTIFLGVFSLAWGGLEIANASSLLAFRLPVFEILLIALGVFFLARGLLRVRQAGMENAS